MISLKHVNVLYGQLKALDDLTLDLPSGEVFGFIGPNGAGKSTTMKVLACLLRPTSGEAHVDGRSVTKEPDSIRRIIGYMPDFLGVYDDLTVDEYLQFFASAFEVPRAKRRALIDGVLELTDLTEKRHAMVDSLSRGMQQRLGVARVLVHDPKVLLLDEPASGLDPRARIEMRALLGELRQMGKTIIVSSHILSELGEMCTSIGIIERGKLLYAGSLKDAFARATHGSAERIAIRVEPQERGHQSAAELLGRHPRVAMAKVEDTAAPEIVVELHPRGEGTEPGHHFLIEALVAEGWRISAIAPKEHKLEDVFLRLTQGNVQ